MLGKIWVALGSLILALPLAAAEPGIKVQFVGGTVSGRAAKSKSQLDLTGSETLLISFGPRAEFRIAYQKINTVEYGQNVSRRYAEAVLISPLLLLSKSRKHFVTIGLCGCERANNRRWSSGLRKATSGPCSASLEARTGRRIEYQDATHERQERDEGISTDSGRVSRLPSAADTGPSAVAMEEDSLKQLLQIRRVYVDHLTGGDTAAQMRDILLSSLESSNLFVLTENPERADVTLKGAAEDLVFTEVHSFVGQFECADECGHRPSPPALHEAPTRALAWVKARASIPRSGGMRRWRRCAWSIRTAT